MMTSSHPTTHQPPITPKQGWVATQYRHYKGKRLGPYYVRCWKSKGKTHREYIKRADLERVRAQCQANRDERHRQQQMLVDFRIFKGNFNYLGRMLNRLRRSNVLPEHHEHIKRILLNGYFVPGRPSLRSHSFSIQSILRSAMRDCSPSPSESFMHPLITAPTRTNDEEGEGLGVGVHRGSSELRVPSSELKEAFVVPGVAIGSNSNSNTQPPTVKRQRQSRFARLFFKGYNSVQQTKANEQKLDAQAEDLRKAILG